MQQFNPQQPLDPKALAVTPYPTLASAANLPYPTARYGSEWNDESQSEVSVLQYWRILCRQRKTILVAAIAGLILGFLAGVPMKPVYRARTSLEELSFNDDFMNVKETNPVSNGNSADTSAEENQSKLLQSYSLREHVSRTFGFRKSAADAQADVAPAGWRHWLHLPAPTTLTGRERLVSGVAD